MMRLERFERYTDGTGTVVGAERDDARGRHDTDRAAFLALESSDVESVHVQHAERVCGGKKGSHR
jgi:hypothetical protein